MPKAPIWVARQLPTRASRGSAESRKERQIRKRMKSPQNQARINLSVFAGIARSCCKSNKLLFPEKDGDPGFSFQALKGSSRRLYPVHPDVAKWTSKKPSVCVHAQWSKPMTRRAQLLPYQKLSSTSTNATGEQKS